MSENKPDRIDEALARNEDRVDILVMKIISELRLIAKHYRKLIPASVIEEGTNVEVQLMLGAEKLVAEAELEGYVEKEQRPPL